MNFFPRITSLTTLCDQRSVEQQKSLSGLCNTKHSFTNVPISIQVLLPVNTVHLLFLQWVKVFNLITPTLLHDY